MDSITVRAIELINFAPKTVREEIEQNLRFIVTTSVDTVPLFRKFSLEKTMLDKPIQVIEALFSAELIKKAKAYEPRAVIDRIDYSDSDWRNGTIEPTIFYKIKE